MEIFMKEGRFPPLPESTTPYVETEVKTKSPFEILQIFTVLGLVGLMWNNVRKLYIAITKMFG